MTAGGRVGAAATARPAAGTRPPGGAGAPPAVAVDDLTRRFGSTVAVDGLSLEVGRGELVALVGPSGCGKSTILRLVAGLLEADRGEVRLGGQVVTARSTFVPPERRPVGIVFQEQTLFPHLTVAGNVSFGLRGRPGPAARQRVQEVLELVDLPGHAGRYPHELSGGERQRAALARALAPEPAVVLLDEPFSSLDRNLRVQIRTELVGILRRAGAAALFVTHDQPEAMAVGDRVAVLRAGRLEQVGTPDAVFHRPASRFVATFMGEADFLPVSRQGGWLRTEAGACPAPPGPPDGHGPNDAGSGHRDPVGGGPAGAASGNEHSEAGGPASGGPGRQGTSGNGLVMMVRPHEVTFRSDPAGDSRVVGSEFQGGFVLYELALPSGRRLRSLQSHTVTVAPGSRVTVELAHGHTPALLDGGPPAGRGAR